MARLGVALALAAVVAGVAWVLQRRRPTGGPAPTRHHVPTVVDRRDFERPGAPWLVAVFTSASCSSCASVLAAAGRLGSGDVVVQEVEVAEQAELHRRYDIDAVPLTLFCDRSGAVRRSFAGPVGPEELAAALEDLA